jgi:hypothetical protein
MHAWWPVPAVRQNAVVSVTFSGRPQPEARCPQETGESRVAFHMFEIKVGHTSPESFLLRRYGRYWRIGKS